MEWKSNENPGRYVARIETHFEEGKLVDGYIGCGPVTVTDIERDALYGRGNGDSSSNMEIPSGELPVFINLSQ